jgi:hypothetical protein
MVESGSPEATRGGFLRLRTGSGNTSRGVSLNVTSALDFAFQSQGLTETGTLQMVIQGSAGTEVVLEAGVNFMNWTSIATNQIGTDGTLTVSGPDSASLPMRFYRLRASP